MDSHIDNGDIVETLRQLASASVLPHIIIYGPSGIGKTNLAKLFIQEYLEMHGIPVEEHRKYILAVPSSDDRGIKFVRTQVRDFAKECHKQSSSSSSSSSSGSDIVIHSAPSQIIFMDDCDTLPPLSQQALRRIMEQYDSRTAFIFVANRINVFTDPIQSRCVVLRMTPVNVLPYAGSLAAEFGCSIGATALNRLVTLSVGNLRQFIQYLQVLALVIGAEQEATETDIEALCDAPPLIEVQQLLGAFLSGNNDNVTRVCIHLWESGYPLSDLLNYIQIVCNVYGTYNNEELLRINESVGRGAVMCIDNHVHLWDMISLWSS
jgi:DNA polymerase III delta prime subunit